LNGLRSRKKTHQKKIYPTKALLRNKLGRAGEVILCANKAKNTGIAKATARLFNAVSVQKNKSEWLSCFVTKPKRKTKQRMSQAINLFFNKI
jgi:hypothetical protein